MPNIKQKDPYQKRLWNYTPSKYDMERVGWCLNNGIKISPLGIQGDLNHYYIDVEIMGKRYKSPRMYHIDETSKTIYGFYFDYYDKYKDCLEWWKELSDEERGKYEKHNLTSIKKYYDDREVEEGD